MSGYPTQRDFTSPNGVEVRSAQLVNRKRPSLDEVVATCQPFHLEYMSSGHVWMRVGDVSINLWARNGVIDGRAEIDA